MEVERRQFTSRFWKGGGRLIGTRELPAYLLALLAMFTVSQFSGIGQAK